MLHRWLRHCNLTQLHLTALVLLWLFPTPFFNAGEKPVCKFCFQWGFLQQHVIKWGLAITKVKDIDRYNVTKIKSQKSDVWWSKLRSFIFLLRKKPLGYQPQKVNWSEMLTYILCSYYKVIGFFCSTFTLHICHFSDIREKKLGNILYT